MKRHLYLNADPDNVPVGSPPGVPAPAPVAQIDYAALAAAVAQAVKPLIALPAAPAPIAPPLAKDERPDPNAQILQSVKEMLESHTQSLQAQHLESERQRTIEAYRVPAELRTILPKDGLEDFLKGDVYRKISAPFQANPTPPETVPGTKTPKPKQEPDRPAAPKTWDELGKADLGKLLGEVFE